MKAFISYVTICLGFLFVMSCSNMEEPITSCDGENMAVIKEIAKKYGYNDIQIKYEGERSTPLTDQELQGYEGYFKELKRIDGMGFTMTQGAPVSRVFESDVYRGSVYYGGSGFDVAVYWMKDNQTGEIAYVEGGLGGSSLGDIHEYPYPELALNQSNGMVYTMINQGRIFHGASGGVIDLTLKADLIVERYIVVDGKIQFDKLYYDLTTKVTAFGRVDTNSHTGSFSVQSVGSGNWNEI